MKKVLLGIVLFGATCFANAGIVAISDFSGSESVEDFSSLGSAPGAGAFSLGDLTFSESSYGTGGPGWRLLSCCSTPIPDNVLTDNAGISNIFIDFSTLYTRVGLDVGFFGQSAQYDVSFYDSSMSLLGVVSGMTNNNAFFAGWESTSGIARISIAETSGDNHYVGGIDNIRFENATSVPEPTSIALLSLGLVGLGFSRKKAKS